MKYIKLFENKEEWTLDKVKKLRIEYSKLKELASDYIWWKKKYTGEDNIWIEDVGFRNNQVIIKYSDLKSGDNYIEYIKNEDEFFAFLNDPDMFNETGKFNL